MKTHASFPRALALGGKSPVEVLEDHERRGVARRLLEQRDQLAALVVSIAQIERVWPDVRVCGHDADGGNFPIAGTAVEQVPPPSVMGKLNYSMYEISGRAMWRPGPLRELQLRKRTT